MLCTSTSTPTAAAAAATTTTTTTTTYYYYYYFNDLRRGSKEHFSSSKKDQPMHLDTAKTIEALKAHTKPKTTILTKSEKSFFFQKS